MPIRAPQCATTGPAPAWTGTPLISSPHTSPEPPDQPVPPDLPGRSRRPGKSKPGSAIADHRTSTQRTREPMLLCMSRAFFLVLWEVGGSWVLLGTDKTGMGRSRWRRKLLLGHAQQVRDGAGDGRRIVRRPAGSRQPNMRVRPPPELGCYPAAGAEVAVDLAGDVALEAADDLRLGLSFCRAALDVGAGGRVRAQPGEHDPPQGVVGLAVAAGVEPVAGDFPRRCGDRGGAAQVRPGRLAAQPFGVIPGRDEQQRRGVAGRPRRGRAGPGRGRSTSGTMSSSRRSSWPSRNSARRPSSRSAMRVA